MPLADNPLFSLASPRPVAWDPARGVYVLAAARREPPARPAEPIAHEQARTRDRYNALFLYGPPAPVLWGPTQAQRRRERVAAHLKAALQAAFR